MGERIMLKTQKTHKARGTFRPARPIRGMTLVCLTLGSFLWSSVMLILASNTFQQDGLATLPQVAAGNEAPEVTVNNPAYLFSGTYTFAGELDGHAPSVGTVLTEGGGSVYVVDSMAGHAKVLKYVNLGTPDSYAGWDDSWATTRASGTIEFWGYIPSGSRGITIYLRSGSGYAFGLDFYNALAVYSDGNWNSNQFTITPDEWHHCRIVFDCGANTAYLFVDGSQVGDAWTCSGEASVDRLNTWVGATVSTAYIDAIGYSWDPYYQIGKNQFVNIPRDYKGVYSFTDDEIGSVPVGFDATLPIGGGGKVEVEGNQDNHNKVVLLSHGPSTSPIHDCYLQNKEEQGCTSGTIEFWAKMAGGPCNFHLLQNPSLGDGFWITFVSYGLWYTTTGGVDHQLRTENMLDGLWHHWRFTFTTSSVTIYRDSVTIGTASPTGSPARINYFRWDAANADSRMWVDAVGHSWVTRSFTGDPIGGTPSGYFVQQPVSGSVHVDSAEAGRATVVHLNHGADGTSRDCYIRDQDPQVRSSGTVEFWAKMSAGNGQNFFLFQETYIQAGFWITFVSYGLWYTTTGGVDHQLRTENMLDGQWHHWRFDFTTASVVIYRDGVSMGIAYPFGGPTSINYLRWDPGSPGSQMWVDTLSYSWNPTYDVGNNLQVSPLPSPSLQSYVGSINLFTGTPGAAPSVGTVYTSGNGAVIVQASQAGHAQVLKFTSDAGSTAGWENDWDIPQTAGIIDFWGYVPSGSRGNSFYLWNGANYAFGIDWYTSVAVYVGNGNWAGNQYTLSTDTWHHGRVAFDCAQNLVHFYIDGVQVGGAWTTCGQASVDRFQVWVPSVVSTTYVDAIGYSWDPAYAPGGNVHPGLLAPAAYAYAGARDFAGDAIGSIPAGFDAAYPGTGGGSVQVEIDLNSRYKVVHLKHGTNNDPTHDCYLQNEEPESRISGTIEFWAKMAGGPCNFHFLEQDTTFGQVGYWITFVCSGLWYTTTGGVDHQLRTENMLDGLWHHWRFTFTTSSVNIYRDDVSIGTASPAGSPTRINYFRWDAANAGSELWVDAIGYSWVTRSFTGDPIGGTPSGYFVQQPVSGSVHVDSAEGEREMVVHINHGADGTSQDCYIRDQDPQARTAGTVEFWAKMSGGLDTHFFMQQSTDIDQAGFWITFVSYGLWWSANNIDHQLSTENMLDGQWHFWRFDFTTASVVIYRDGDPMGTALSYGSPTSINYFQWDPGSPSSQMWVDSIGYSWNTDYSVGGNYIPSHEPYPYYICNPSQTPAYSLSWTLRDSITGPSPTYDIIWDSPSSSPVPIQSGTWLDGAVVTLDLNDLPQPLAIGQHTFTLVADDGMSAPNSITTRETTLGINGPPILTFSGVTEAGFIDEDPRVDDVKDVTWTITDLHLIGLGAKWEVYHDGELVAHGTFTASGQIVKPTHVLSYGEHSYTCWVTDGYASASNTRTITVDVTDWHCDAGTGLYYAPYLTQVDPQSDGLTVTSTVEVANIANQLGEIVWDTDGVDLVCSYIVEAALDPDIDGTYFDLRGIELPVSNIFRSMELQVQFECEETQLPFDAVLYDDQAWEGSASSSQSAYPVTDYAKGAIDVAVTAISTIGGAALAGWGGALVGGIAGLAGTFCKTAIDLDTNAPPFVSYTPPYVDEGDKWYKLHIDMGNVNRPTTQMLKFSFKVNVPNTMLGQITLHVRSSFVIGRMTNEFIPPLIPSVYDIIYEPVGFNRDFTFTILGHKEGEQTVPDAPTYSFTLSDRSPGLTLVPVSSSKLGERAVKLINTGNVVETVHLEGSTMVNFPPPLNDIKVYPGIPYTVPFEVKPSAWNEILVITAYYSLHGPPQEYSATCLVSPHHSRENLASTTWTKVDNQGLISGRGVGQVDITTYNGRNQDWWGDNYAPYIYRSLPGDNFYSIVHLTGFGSAPIENMQLTGMIVYSDQDNVFQWGLARDDFGYRFITLECIAGGTGYTYTNMRGVQPLIPTTSEDLWLGIQRMGSSWSFWYTIDNTWVSLDYSWETGGARKINWNFVDFNPTAIGLFQKEWSIINPVRTAEFRDYQFACF